MDFSLLDLPPEVLHRIVRWLAPVDVIRLMCTSHAVRAVLNDRLLCEAVWERCRRQVPSTVPLVVGGGAFPPPTAEQRLRCGEMCVYLGEWGPCMDCRRLFELHRGEPFCVYGVSTFAFDDEMRALLATRSIDDLHRTWPLLWLRVLLWALDDLPVQRAMGRERPVEGAWTPAMPWVRLCRRLCCLPGWHLRYPYWVRRVIR